MNILKQSTAATIKLGPFIDDTDGKTAETGLTISQADIRLSKNGGDIAQTHNSAGATADELGYYDVPLDTTDTNTLGRLLVAVHESGALPVWKEFLVVTANVYDTLCSSDKLDVAVVEMATDVLAAAAVKADAVTKIQNGLAPANEYDARMTAMQADLDNPDQYKADVSALATTAHVQEVEDKVDIVDGIVDDILVDTSTTLDGKLDTVDTVVDAIKAKTDLIPATPAQAGEYTAAIAAIPTAPLLAANYTAPDNTSIAAIKEKTDNLPASPAPANEYDTELTAIQTDLDNPDQYKADVSSLAKATDLQDVEDKIDAVDAKVSAIDTDTVMSFMIDGFTFEQIVQIMASVLAGKLTRSGDTLTFRDLADTVNRVVAETDANKQRTTMTYTV